jgi:endonuclease VIII
MPEGHSVHRTANKFSELFVGSKLIISSPQGRFAEQATLVSGRKLIESSAIGKQLFLGFDNKLTIRVHLGIYGKWNFYNVSLSKAPEVWGQVRARFGSNTASADLRGPTVCEVVDAEDVLQVLKRLGPDPLRPDPSGKEGLRFVSKVRGSAVPIGALLMNQAVISGIGNVYRAELLFRAGISPHKVGNKVSEQDLLAIWDDAVALMKIGVKTGMMLTREGFLKARVLVVERYNVYKREGLPCRSCGKKVKLELFNGRKLYWCNTCQR